MKTAGKVALVGGLGILAIVAAPAFLMTGFGIFGDRAKKTSPEDEKRWQELRAKGQPIPAVMRAPDGSMVRVAPDGTVLGPVVSGNPRGYYD
jgi:hypothetical protein